MKPYIGVTGFSTSKQAEKLSRVFKQNLPEYMNGMFGILLSYKDLIGKHDEIKAGWINKYPGLENIPQILENIDQEFLPILHYNTKGNFYKELKNILPDLMKKGLKGIQLNIVWPNEQHLKKLKKEFPNLQVVLQISHKAAENKTQSQIVSKLNSYGTNFDYCLFDMSGGLGLQREYKGAFNFYKECKKQGKETPHIFVGGLSSDNVSKRIKEIYSQGINNFGIDAEGQLMDKTKTLSIEKASKYIINASNTYKSLKN